MPKNSYLRRIAHVQTVKDEILQAWTAQLCMDIMTIVLNDELHLGHDRLTRVGAAWNTMFSEIYPKLHGTDEDYIRAKIDERIRRIMGADFIPWEERYRGYGK